MQQTSKQMQVTSGLLVPGGSCRVHGLLGFCPFKAPFCMVIKVVIMCWGVMRLYMPVSRQHDHWKTYSNYAIVLMQSTSHWRRCNMIAQYPAFIASCE